MNNLPTNYANYKILAGLVWGDRKNSEETEGMKVNNADERLQLHMQSLKMQAIWSMQM